MWAIVLQQQQQPQQDYDDDDDDDDEEEEEEEEEEEDISRVFCLSIMCLIQENNIRLSSRMFQLILEMFEDVRGVDYEQMWRSIVRAQAKTGARRESDSQTFVHF